MDSPSLPSVDDQATTQLNQDQKSGNEKSTIVTTEPYTINRNKNTVSLLNKEREQLDLGITQRKRRKFRLDPTLVHFDTLFSTENWPRYLIIKTVTEISAMYLQQSNRNFIHVSTAQQQKFHPTNWNTQI